MKFFRLEEVKSEAKTSAKIWTLTFDTPGEKVNKLSREVMTELSAVFTEIDRLASAGRMGAIVFLSGKPGNFIAGADIEMIRSAKNEEEAFQLSRAGHALANRWEDLPFPKVAAIDGAALGGGFEFALASGTIVMSDDAAAKIGLPEVQLGILPGMGGCVRLPRRVGLANALDLILSSKTLNGERAYKAGIVDAVLPKQDFVDTVLKWTDKNLAALKAGQTFRKEPKLGGVGGILGSVMEKTYPGRALILKKARDGVMSKTQGHYPAPLEVITVMRENGASFQGRLCPDSRDRAMVREARGFGRLAATEVSKNLIRLFFMTEAVKKSKGVDTAVVGKKGAVVSGAVLGAGVMGGGIAQLFADKGIHARMKDLTPAALQLGVQSASRIFKKSVERRKISKRQYTQKMNLIGPTLDFSGFHMTEVVVEAIVENMDVKKKVLAELENYIGPETVVASNTSSLSISKMQEAFKSPARFVGMHFFNPVHRMPLVEVIRGEKSSDRAVSTIYQFSKQLGKIPIVVKDSPGFLVNRLLIPYCNEAVFLVGDGVPVDELDRILLKFGMPMGPMELIDEVGIDVGVKVSHILNDAFGERMPSPPLNEKVVAAKRLGKKTGKGIYVYDAQGRNKKLDPEIYTIFGVTPKRGAISEEEIVDRCILPMINEASRCLEEHVVETAADVDLGMIMGTGFPPFRGGLLRYADTIGAKVLVEKLKKYEVRFGKRYEPSKAMLERAASGRRFHEI